MANVYRISYLQSVKSCEGIGHQLIINTDEGVFFYSYETLIVRVYRDANGKWCADVAKDWNISRTTKVYTAKFLGKFGFPVHSSMDVESAINRGQITLVEHLTFDMYIHNKD